MTASAISMVLMKQFVPEPLPEPDDPSFNDLHRACLLWVYYLRAESEVKKQAFLYEAARHLMVLEPCGDEGEQVYAQVWEAIRRRELARASVKTNAGYKYVEATDEGSFSAFKVIAY
ncbi:hypothetical protein [Shinella sp. HZN7]|uniref:hypothetical protein n=1 Tax=Shinella sp. (strain HZN7) TaxID=879274 RepID=UPI000AFB9D9A|nr:hypothetical protein [Shinella sp. HZN7]